jgi:hypothetical protein
MGRERIDALRCNEGSVGNGGDACGVDAADSTMRRFYGPRAIAPLQRQPHSELVNQRWAAQDGDNVLQQPR